MNYDEYEKEISPINAEITKIVNPLVPKIRAAAEENHETLWSLLMDDDFIFISDDNKPLKISEDHGIELFSWGSDTVYFEPLMNKIVYYQYNSDIEMTVSEDVDDEVLAKCYQDISNYKKTMHVVGLSGVLEKHLEQRKAIMEGLKAGLE